MNTKLLKNSASVFFFLAVFFGYVHVSKATVKILKVTASTQKLQASEGVTYQIDLLTDSSAPPTTCTAYLGREYFPVKMQTCTIQSQKSGQVAVLASFKAPDKIRFLAWPPLLFWDWVRVEVADSTGKKDSSVWVAQRLEVVPTELVDPRKCRMSDSGAWDHIHFFPDAPFFGGKMRLEFDRNRTWGKEDCHFIDFTHIVYARIIFQWQDDQNHDQPDYNQSVAADSLLGLRGELVSDLDISPYLLDIDVNVLESARRNYSQKLSLIVYLAYDDLFTETYHIDVGRAL